MNFVIIAYTDFLQDIYFGARYNINEMNKELNTGIPFDKFPIICSILGLIFIYEIAKFGTFFSLFLHFEKTNLIISYM